jgi:hypothetical protein
VQTAGTSSSSTTNNHASQEFPSAVIRELVTSNFSSDAA